MKNLLVILLSVVLFSCTKENIEPVINIEGIYQGTINDAYETLLIETNQIIYRDAFIADNYTKKNDSLVFNAIHKHITWNFKLKYNVNQLSGTKTKSWIDTNGIITNEPIEVIFIKK